MYERVDISKYKGALIEYKCAECYQIPKTFFESFQNKIARIKSDSCLHMSFKFISNYDRNNFKYTVSLNCLNCGQNKIKNLFDKDSGDSSNLEYKCEKCGQGDLKFGILLSEEIIEMDENNNDENQNENNNNNKMNQNENSNNNMKQNAFINNNIINNNNNIEGNNFNQGFGANLALGNNMNNNNNNGINNMNNNMLKDVNNMFLYNNMNNNFNQFNNMMFNNNQIMNNGIKNCNINTNMVFNIKKNNYGIMNSNDNMINQPIINENNNNKFILNFCDMIGHKYPFESSPDVPFAEVIRNLLNKYPDIDRENIAVFICNGKRVKNQKTVKENGISNGDKVMIHFKN